MAKKMRKMMALLMVLCLCMTHLGCDQRSVSGRRGFGKQKV